jgi:sugar phosphate permease
MLSLILAGESIFLPVFHLGRYFKSSMLCTLGIDELELGQLGAIYGVFATASYFIGGPLADRFSPRKLMAVSLVATALGSVYMAIIPSFTALQVLFAFWGVTTIFAFWAPLIRATREWAGPDQQARAFGLLDAGRGLTSAAIASLATIFFRLTVGDAAEVDAGDERVAVVRLALFYAGYCLLAALCVWLFVADSSENFSPETPQPGDQPSLAARVARVLRSPVIWLQSIVIIASYSAFKMIDNAGLYAQDAYGFSRADSAELVAWLSYLRVGAALAAGWIADKWLGVRATIQICFGTLLAAYVLLLVVPPSSGLVALMVANLAVTCASFFALRGIYFALIDDSGIPASYTGTAAGIISFVGFTPEIFMGPLTGWLIRDARASGAVLVGYQQIFLFLAVMVAAGMLATAAIKWFRVKR